MNRKFAMISLVGAPNAGKSTLVNRLVGEKVSIVTPKVQTTRDVIRGIMTVDNAQLVIADTPGIFSAQKQRDKTMVKAAYGSMEGVDIVMLLVDAGKFSTTDSKLSDIISALNRVDYQKILVINKIDKVKKDILLAIAKELNGQGKFYETFMVSALNGDGVEDLKEYLVNNAPEGDWLYPEDQVSDLPLRLFAAEITREKLMMQLQHELPYGAKVETESWEEDNKKNSITIRQIIYVASDSHKKIAIGKGGHTIKQIGEQSRRELQKSLDKKVNLFLFVKIL